MHVAREILRQMFLYRMGDRQIARSCKVSHVTVGNYRQQVGQRQLTYDQLEKMSDTELELLLKNKRGRKQQHERPQPDLHLIHQELRKKGVTLQLLWEEYKTQYPDGYEKSQFNELYRMFRGKLDLTMRQSHKGGEKMFVDYSGLTIPVTDPATGIIHPAQIFTAVLGASSYTYAEASVDQGLASWIRSHVNAFQYFGGVPAIIIPDNLKSGVNTPCRYDPEINRSYHEMSVHYDTVIMPARVRKPKDKAKVEAGVLVVQRWILAALRHRQFFNLEALNAEIIRLLDKLNRRPFKKMKGSRRSVFEATDQPQLKPLPQQPYVFARWLQPMVGNDYHVEVDDHHYSVPFNLAGQRVDIRVTDKTVEIFSHTRRIASHLKKTTTGDKTTLPEHMPKNHRLYLEATPAVLLDWAAKVGEATHRVIQSILNGSRHAEQGFRSGLGIMRLGKRYPDKRLEAACRRALIFGSCSYQSLRSILEKGLDKEPVSETAITPPIQHTNLRGRSYYDHTAEPISGEYLC